MKRLFSTLFTAMLVFGSFAAWAQVTPMKLNESHFYRNSELMEGAFGTHCGYNEVNGISRCRTFQIQTNVNTAWQQDETLVMLQQSVSGPYDWGWRYVTCPVPRSSMQLKTKSAQVDVTFDTEGPGCWGYGYRQVCQAEEPWECEWSEWPYFGMATLQAQLSSPGGENEYTESRQESSRNNMTGTTSSSRWNCTGGDAFQMVGGGFTMFGDAIFGNAWFPFETEEADGSFSYRSCSRMGKEKTKN
jgi:hypothetical protein